MQRPIPTDPDQLLFMCNVILKKFRPSDDSESEQQRTRMRASALIEALNSRDVLGYDDRLWIKDRYWGDCVGEWQFSENSPTSDRATNH